MDNTVLLSMIAFNLIGTGTGFVTLSTLLYWTVAGEMFPALTCPQSWVLQKDKCYRIFDELVTWPDALATCERSHATLLNLDDLTEQTFILQLRPVGSNQSHWIGYYRNESGWSWTDTSTVKWEDERVHALLNASDGDCTAFPWTGVWTPTDCDTKLAFFCEMNPIECPMHEGWLYFNDMCYMIGHENFQWTEARTECKKHGADLAIVKNAYSVESFLQHFNIAVLLWVNFEYINATSSFMWSDGDIVTQHTNISLSGCGSIQHHVTTSAVIFSGQMCDSHAQALCELVQADGDLTLPPNLFTTAVTSQSMFPTGSATASTIQTTSSPVDEWIRNYTEKCSTLRSQSRIRACISGLFNDSNVLCTGNELASNYSILVDTFDVHTVLQSLLDLSAFSLQPNMTFATCNEPHGFAMDILEGLVGDILRLVDTYQNIHIAGEYIEVIVESQLAVPDSYWQFESQITGCNSYNISLPSNNGTTSETTGVFMVVTSAFKMTVNVDNSFSEPMKPHYIVSPVMVLSLYTDQGQLVPNHTFTMFYISEHVLMVQDNSKRESQSQLYCAFYDTFSSLWSRVGCVMLHVDDYTITCHCSHTTSFAVLMKITYVELPREQTIALSVITIIGCSVSIITSFLALTVFTCIRSLQSERVFVHRNLCLAILLAQILFLAGIRATAYRTVCRVVALLLHYCFLSVFTWMLVEGLHLYTKVVQVFSSARSRNTYNMIFGWGIPLLLVGISAAADWDGYGTRTSCWLSISRHTVWAFVGPAIAVILVNLVILAMVVKIVVKSTRCQQPSNLRQTRAAVKAALVLQPLLGLTWLFGLLAVNRATLVFDYLFALCNSLQGFFIFICHCVLNTEVRQSLQRLRERRALLNDGGNSSSSGPSVGDTDIALAHAGQVAGIVHFAEGTVDVHIRYKNRVRYRHPKQNNDVIALRHDAVVRQQPKKSGVSQILRSTEEECISKTSLKHNDYQKPVLTDFSKERKIEDPDDMSVVYI